MGGDSGKPGRSFSMTQGFGYECAACLDALVAKAACMKEEVEEGKEMLLRINSILTKLISLFDSTSSSSSSSVVRETADVEEFEIEEEDEDEK
jgi:inorganic triphosphatase YgiF